MTELGGIICEAPPRTAAIIVHHKTDGHEAHHESFRVQKMEAHGISVTIDLRELGTNTHRELRIAESMPCTDVFCLEIGTNVVALPIDREGTALLFLLTDEQHQHPQAHLADFVQLARRAVTDHPELATTFDEKRPFAA